MNYFKENINYFLNFYTFSQIFLVANHFVYREYKVVANFIREELLKYIFSKNKYLLGFMTKFFFIISFKFVQVFRSIIDITKLLGLNLIKIFIFLKG